MKIAFVTRDDPQDIHAWSGTVSYIYKAFGSTGHSCLSIGNLPSIYKYLFFPKRLFYSGVLKKSYLWDREPLTIANYAKQIRRRLDGVEYDVVFSPGTLPVARLREEKPVVFWTDATFAGMVDFYPEFSNLCVETVRKANQVEQEALSNCRLAIYSSEWAARTALENYEVDPEKVKVVPFGANIECNRTEEDIEAMTAKKNFDVCKLVLVGVDWVRKGADLAVRVAEQLNQQGILAELHVVGCHPPGPVPDFVKIHGFVSKKTEEGCRFFNELFSSAHFSILPSQAECCAMVLAEAGSFGLPTLATDVGGIPTAIRNGKNGFIFPLDADPDAYCDAILTTMTSRSAYEALARASFKEYTERLNWNAAAATVKTLLEECCDV